MFKLFSFGKKESSTLSLTVEKVTRETPEAVTLHFRQPEKSLTYLPGQFLTLVLKLGKEEVRRSYSMSSSPYTDQLISVTVKRVPGGKVSQYLNDTVESGQVIQVLEPAGRFTLEPEPSQSRHIVLLGAGSGITPLISMAKSVLSQEPGSQVSLLYGSRNEASIIFKDQLEGLRQQYAGRFELEHILSQPSASWTGYTGRLNRQMILEILDKISPAIETLYFICGPSGMMEEALEALRLLKVAEEDIRTESFFSSAPATGKITEGGAIALEEHQVTLLYEGSEYKVRVGARQSILEAALEEGIQLPYSCQSGMCTACMGICRSGKVKLDEEEGLSKKEREAGYVLTCVGHPLTDDVVIEIQ
jgi:ring-1,2-phenylacetyl-CoA epoxidase subunit PaaE